MGVGVGKMQHYDYFLINFNTISVIRFNGYETKWRFSNIGWKKCPIAHLRESKPGFCAKDAGILKIIMLIFGL